MPLYVKELKEFSKRYWEFYRKLLEYKKNPSKEFEVKLAGDFERLFSEEGKYEELNERIKKTKMKKGELLLVLKYPELPLHNNDSELGARAKVRKRDVSLQTRTVEGTRAKDTFLTITQTAKKLGVSSYKYIQDRVSKKYEMTSLADLIKKKSSEKGRTLIRV